MPNSSIAPIDWYGMEERINHVFALHEAGRYQEVVDLLSGLPLNVLEEPRAAYLLGSALASLGRKEDACEAFGRARLESPEARYWQQCRQLKVWIEFGF